MRGMTRRVVEMFVAVSLVVLVVATPPLFANRATAAQRDAEAHARESGDVSAPGVTWSEGADLVVLEVPFMFAVGSDVLPAGTYTVARESDNPEVLRITDASGRRGTFVDTRWSGLWNNGVHAVVTFRDYGGDHVLTAVALPGEDTQTIPLTKKALVEDVSRMAAARYHLKHTS
jgi:hypothetical protein